MSIIALDLGGTKLAVALLSEAGKIISKEVIPLGKKVGKEVGLLVTDQVKNYKTSPGSVVQAIGISVPGISHQKTGRVWAPNIAGWEDYPLVHEIQQVAGNVPVTMDSDRACSILGEQWLGNARGCKDAIYLAVGTGIGAGILTEGRVLRGAQDIAGAVGWMALKKPFEKKYIPCGCFEYYASGEGIVKLTRELLAEFSTYRGVLREQTPENITAHHLFSAYENNDPIAIRVFEECIEYWGMAVANLISIFNPEKVIFGGGIFGPAAQFIPAIKEEATKWAQPISMNQVIFEESGLQGDATIYGAGYLALKSIQPD
jgi:glucokinase